MPARRKQPDGLPARLYKYAGKRVTTFFIKNENNTREELSQARTNDAQAVRVAQGKAIEEYGRRMGAGAEDTAWLIDEYFKWQEKLPVDSNKKKASSTIYENKREAENLKLIFGKMSPAAIEPHHCYAYIDERAEEDNAGVKAGKEISLLAAVLEYGRRRGKVMVNVAKGIEKPKNAPMQIRVEWSDIELLTEAGRVAGGSYLIMALAARFAWLTLRRSGEVRRFTRNCIKPEGCEFVAAKRKRGQAVLTGTIEWSPLLRACVDEALQIRRWGAGKPAQGQKTALVGAVPARYVFGNMAGQAYTKGGWKQGWDRLHTKAAALATAKDTAIQYFSLQDCRPGGVSEKEERGDTDTVDATLHTDKRMISQIYDRRKTRTATPAR